MVKDLILLLGDTLLILSQNQLNKTNVLFMFAFYQCVSLIWGTGSFILFVLVTSRSNWSGSSN